METENKTETCLACQYAKHWEETSCWQSAEARNHWMLFGCSCDPESDCDANYWLKLITD